MCLPIICVHIFKVMKNQRTRGIGILYVEFRNFQEGSGGLTKEVGGFGGG